jgi:O-antigen/teichoic acid export membrane protein
MAAKMGLAIYMGRFFNLAEMGVYGLTLGAVTMLSVLTGQDFVYVVHRDIVGADPATALHKMRDQAVLYGLNYLALAVVIGALIVTHSVDIPSRILWYTLGLTICESFGTVCYYNLNSLNFQVRANGLFFIRAGLWVFPVVALCMINPAWRTADTVLIGWMAGSGMSLLVTLWLWRELPWKEVMPHPVDWMWIRKGIKVCSLIWLGMLGLTAGTFVDRFVVEHYLSLEDVGVLTFYFSFTNAMLTLVDSGIAAFATPLMIQHHRDGNANAFHTEARRASKQIAISAGLLALGLGIGVPLLGSVLGRPAFIASMNVFFMMLFGTWLRANAEMEGNVLFARHQDRAMWLGNLLFLIPALGGNLLLVPLFGLNGIGFSAVLAASFLLIWRWGHTSRYTRRTSGSPHVC